MPGVERKSARLTDVAKRSGVSPGLVSRIINDDPSLRVRDATRQRVLEAIKLLNYTPHASARALRSSQTGLLGFTLHHVNDPIYVGMVDAAQTAAAKLNYSVMLLDTDELAERRDAFHELVGGRRIDGLLIQSGFESGGFELQELARALPSVVFNANPIPDLRTIRLDDAEAARIATNHLIELGHTAIAYVGAEGSSSERRFGGYLAAMDSAELLPLPQIRSGWDSDVSHDAMLNYFANGGTATAFVVVTTTTALGVSSGIVAAGKRIPDDVSLVSIHDTWFAKHLNPPLTAVSLPLKRLGELAVPMLVDLFSASSTGETVVREPAPELVVRQSAAPANR